MQTGKLILSAAALVATAAGSFAFKTANKFTAGHKLFVQVTNALGGHVACVTCRSVRTKLTGGIVIASCATILNGSKVKARNQKTYFTVSTTGKINCTHPWTKAQLSN